MKNILKSIAIMCIACGFYACSNQQTKEVEQESTTEPVLSKMEEEQKLFKADYADSVNAGLIEDTFKGSARREAKSDLMTINYGSPGKRGRVLWNGLVAYNQVWATGSHWATAITLSAPINVAGVDVAPGTYGFFTIPGESEWVLILNSVYDMHLAEEYDEAKDIVRVTVTPELNPTVVQRLTYRIESSEGSKGNIVMEWDQVRVKMPFEVR